MNRGVGIYLVTISYVKKSYEVTTIALSETHFLRNVQKKGLVIINKKILIAFFLKKPLSSSSKGAFRLSINDHCQRNF